MVRGNSSNHHEWQHSCYYHILLLYGPLFSRTTIRKKSKSCSSPRQVNPPVIQNVYSHDYSPDPTKYNSFFFTPWTGSLKRDPHSCNLIQKPESHQLSALDQPNSIHDSNLVTATSVCLKIGYPNPSTGLCFCPPLIKRPQLGVPPFPDKAKYHQVISNISM